jgi:glutamyl-tRNA synthetase
MRIPKLYLYGKLNISGSVLSKRKIKEGIQEGKYSGWDDPKLYTLRGLLNRGLHISSLGPIMKETGYPIESTRALDPKIVIWSINRKIIDKIATRYCVLSNENIMTVKILSGSKEIWIPKFYRNPLLGYRRISIDDTILIDKTEAEVGRITLMNYSHGFYDGETVKVVSNSGEQTKKLIWLSSTNVVDIKIIFNSGDVKYYKSDVVNIKVGDYVQFIKMSYFMCTSIYPITFIELP